MRKNQKTIAVLTALSTMIATTACSEEEMRKEYETEKSKVYEDFDEKLAQQQDAIVSRVVSELQGTTAPAVTTNYTTALEGTTTYKTTVTSGTTESLNPITMRTHETRGPVPTYTTTTTTETTATTTIAPTTVAQQDIISNLNFIEKEDSHEIPFVTINVSNKYIATSGGGSVSGRDGEGMYWPALLYRELTGKSDEESLDEICKLNSGKGTFILEGTEIDVPFTTYYCSGKSVYEVSEKTGISVNEIIELNRIKNIKEVFAEEKEYLVMVSKEKLDSYKNIEGTKMTILDNGLVVAADRSEKVSNTTYLTYHQIDKNQNFVNRVYINGKTATTTPFAKNVEDITKNGIICSNNTEIYLFNTMSVYTNGTDVLVSAGQLPNSPAGYELVGHKELSNQKKLSLYK